MRRPSAASFAVAVRGVGLGGGDAVAFDVGGLTPATLRVARGSWFASTDALVLAAAGLPLLFLCWIVKRQRAASGALP